MSLKKRLIGMTLASGLAAIVAGCEKRELPQPLPTNSTESYKEQVQTYKKDEQPDNKQKVEVLTPKQAREYVAKYNPIVKDQSKEEQEKFFKEAGLPADYAGAKGYQRFRLASILDFNDAGVRPDVVERFDERFDHSGIIYLHKGGISPEIGNKYGGRIPGGYEYNGNMLNELIQKITDFKPDLATQIIDQYDESLNLVEILKLHKEGVSPQDSRRFVDLNKRLGVKISAEDMVWFVKNNVPFDEVVKKAEKIREEMINEALKK